MNKHLVVRSHEARECLVSLSSIPSSFNILHHSFQHNISDDPPQTNTLVQEDSLKCLNEEISLEEVRAAILLNKDSKSPGIDQIAPHPT